MASLTEAVGELGRAVTEAGDDTVTVSTSLLSTVMKASHGSTGFDLSARCREIVAWRRTGRYRGTELQRMADSLDDQSEGDPPLARAELATIREALLFVAAFDTNEEIRG